MFLFSKGLKYLKTLKFKVMRKLNEIYEVDVVYKRPAFASMESMCSLEDSIVLFRKLITEEKIDFKEFFLVAFLSRDNKVLGISRVSEGTTSSTCVNIKEILLLAVKTNSSSIILCHNHPSGNLKPSESDISLTRKIKGACEFCDITLLDHIILTSESFSSFIWEV